MLEIKNLHVVVDNKEVLKGLNLTINAGEVHAMMGPNGAGKSTLANVLAGREGYEITEGSIHYKGKDLLALAADERAREGVFLGFQYPVEIPGVTNIYFLRAAVNAMRKHRGLALLDAMDFIKFAKEKSAFLKMKEDFLYREVNVGFSGGEKKRNEILQMLLLEPTLAILDETDSGLDIDALRVVSEGINALRDPSRSILLVTHYQRLLDYVQPDKIHVLAQGTIVKSGGKDLALELEKTGYADLEA
jgi:Fe-S cluster assembly ATP-binding protein